MDLPGSRRDSGTDSEMDEELAPARPLSQRRSTTAGLILAALLLLAAGAVRLVTEQGVPFAAQHRPTPARPRPAATVATAATAATVAPGVPAEQLGAQVALHSNPAECPPTIDCTRSGSVPAAFRAAIEQYIPTVAVRHIVAVTQTDPPRIYYRQVLAAANDMHLSVVVTRSDIMDGLASMSSSHTVDNVAHRFVRFVSPDSYEVVIEASGRSAQTSSLATLRLLAADGRLRTQH